MAKFDLSTIGVNGGAREYRVAASATRGRVGEPLNSLSALTAGVSDVNTVVVLTDAKPVVGTDSFIGVCAKDFEVNSAGTVVAHKTLAVLPIPFVTLIRGKAKTVANLDTDSELLGLLWDTVLFDLTSSEYTIDEIGAANTSGLRVENGNTVKGTLDVSVDPRAMRAAVS